MVEASPSIRKCGPVLNVNAIQSGTLIAPCCTLLYSKQSFTNSLSTMKKTLLLSTFLFFTVISYGQDRIREAGLTFQSLNGFGLNYKTGSTSALWRFNSMYLTAYQQNEKDESTEQTERNAGISIRAGREYRKDIVDNLEFRYGFDIFASYNSQKYETRNILNPENGTIQNRKTFHPGVSAVLGVNYVINQKLIFGAEIMPGISYTTGKQTQKSYYNPVKTEKDITGFNMQVSSSSALLTIAYRFMK